MAHLADRFDEISVSPNESVFVHKDFLNRCYISKIDDSESGFIPISVLDIGDQQGSKLDESFGTLSIDHLNAEDQNENDSPIFTDLKSVVPPAGESICEPAIQATLESSAVDQGIESAVHEPTVEPVVQSNAESNGRTQVRSKKVLPTSNLGDVVNSRKRTLANLSMSQDEEMCSTILRRFITSSRSGRGSTATMITQIGEQFFKSSLISISSKKAIWRCYDCQTKTYTKQPDSAVSYVTDPKGRKRTIASKEFEWNIDDVIIFCQDPHTCSGRKEQSVDFLYDQMMRHARLIVNDLKDPSKYTANDILNDSLECIYKSFGRQTVTKTMKAEPENGRHVRSFNDKINRLLSQRREELNSNLDGQNDFSVYEQSIFKFDVEFFQSSKLKLFYDPQALQFLCDNESQVAIDGTFPYQLTHGKEWVQLLKVKTYKKNNNSLVFYCAMNRKTLDQYELIFNRVRILCQQQGYPDFSVAITSSDQEAALIAIAKKFFPSAIYKTCSFHYISARRKQMIEARLKKEMHKRNLKSADPNEKLCAKAWILIKSLPFLPPTVAKMMIDYLDHRVSKLAIDKVQIELEKVIEKLKTDHNDENKLQYINWWSIICETDSFVDTTTGRLENSNLQLKSYLKRNLRNTNESNVFFHINNWASAETRKNECFSSASRPRTKAQLEKRNEVKELGILLQENQNQLPLNQMKKIFDRIIRVLKNF